MELSICIVIKNRSKVQSNYGILPIFQNCIKSIKESVDPNTTEIVIVDYFSTDYPLNLWVQQELGDIKCNIIQIDEKFSKGRGINIAAENSNGKYLFLLDADMIISKNVMDNGFKYLKNNRAYFPICYSYKDHTHRDGWWRASGWGVAFVEKQLWEKNKVPEYYKWGAEDDEFKDKIAKNISIVRENCMGLYHQWHPIESDSKAGGMQQIK